METSFEQYATELAPSLRAQDKPSIFLLTCIDYRYAHRVIDLMDGQGLRRKYDIFSLAGAAAGANEKPKWRDTLIEHIQTARKIKHMINHLIILEHRDCGAYKEFFGLEWAKVTPKVELASHQAQVIKLSKALKKAFKKEIPDLTIASFLLARDEDDVLDTA
jgi:carbonic anhydrase